MCYIFITYAVYICILSLISTYFLFLISLCKSIILSVWEILYKKRDTPFKIIYYVQLPIIFYFIVQNYYSYFFISGTLYFYFH